MSSAPTSNLLGRRLDRLRSLAPNDRVPVSVERPNHAATLAAALGGTVAQGVVVVESSVELPVDRRALSRLPFPAGVDQPLVCLDLETTGLATASGTLAFLVGIGTWAGDRYTVTPAGASRPRGGGWPARRSRHIPATRRMAGDLQRPDLRLAAARGAAPDAPPRPTAAGRAPGPADRRAATVEAPSRRRAPVARRARDLRRRARRRPARRVDPGALLRLSALASR